MDPIVEPRQAPSSTSGTTMVDVPVVKKSVSLDASVAQRIQRAATQDGVSFSTWLTHAVERQLTIRDGLIAVAEWEAEHGALTPEERATARSQLASALQAAAERTTGADAS